MKKEILILTCMFLTAQIISAADVAFSRYSQILVRRPFAPVTSADDEASKNVVTVVAPPAFVKDLRMCAITESPAGVRVGFVNIRVKPPQPYYLYVGDVEDGIELIDADYEKEGVLLRKGGEQFWMYMSGGGAPVAVQRSKGGVPPISVTKSSSYAERRQKRLAEMRQRAADARKMSDAEIEQKLQNYQMDLIRKGLTPLPIKLTDEMDRKLVEEGILPALEE